VTLLQTSSDAQLVTVSCEDIMAHGSWLCCKHLLMQRLWLSCEHMMTHSSWLCCKALLMCSSWLSCEHIMTHSSWLWNTADAQFVTVRCEHIAMHSSWLCCKPCWCTVRDLVMTTSWRDYVAIIVHARQFVTVSCEHIMTDTLWRDYVTNICWCIVCDC